MSDAEARSTVWPSEEIPLDPVPEPKSKEEYRKQKGQDIINPETNMSVRRDSAIQIFTRFLRNSEQVKLKDMLKNNGKFNCIYECPDIKKKWVMTIQEVDL